MPKKPNPNLPIIGWREWLALPDLNISWIKAKVDTGARSSALHAFNIERFQENGIERVRFEIHPVQRSKERSVIAEASVHDVRSVRSSSGQKQERVVILTPVRVLGHTWDIELTLARRDKMGFRMLLGRQAIRRRMLVDPGASYAGGKPKV
ncbi:ATP-dependent zinc protease [Longibacter salinarum]|uniref:ATP-dependent zinc protease n=1 Tax=Longibacter salinarum TaxID=1850348 RepID=A0A2A8D2U2_9BACT|nr:ATP-dependent zinc protease [Longibacter salinarum]